MPRTPRRTHPAFPEKYSIEEWWKIYCIAQSNLEEVSHLAQLSILTKQGFRVGEGICIVDVGEVVPENGGTVLL